MNVAAISLPCPTLCLRIRIAQASCCLVLVVTLHGPLPIAAQTVPVAPQTPPALGDWRFIVDKGRPVAMAKRTRADGDHLAGIRIECGARGNLEYVPVALRSAIKTLWVNGMDDINFTIPLVNGRATGADNAMLSKELLKFDAMAKKDNQKTWTIAMSIDGPETSLQDIAMGGFAQVRDLMLKGCKS